MDKKLNVFQKLALIRQEFMSEGASKSGNNSYSGFQYFELEDIIPKVNPLFAKYQVLFMTSLTEEAVMGRLVNCEDISDTIVFTSPFRTLKEPSKYKQNEIQAIGSSITYFRRYMYFLLLDIVDSDKIDYQNPDLSSEEPVKKAKAPLNALERKKLQSEIVNESQQADPLAIKGLKKVLKEMNGKAQYTEFIERVKPHFKNMSVEACAKYTKEGLALLEKQEEKNEVA